MEISNLNKTMQIQNTSVKKQEAETKAKVDTNGYAEKAEAPSLPEMYQAMNGIFVVTRDDGDFSDMGVKPLNDEKSVYIVDGKQLSEKEYHEYRLHEETKDVPNYEEKKASGMTDDEIYQDFFGYKHGEFFSTIFEQVEAQENQKNAEEQENN